MNNWRKVLSWQEHNSISIFIPNMDLDTFNSIMGMRPPYEDYGVVVSENRGGVNVSKISGKEISRREPLFQEVHTEEDADILSSFFDIIDVLERKNITFRYR